ncbi:MAG: hypothetical protein E7553_02440 [Ruminococcaceae bacterium]|nr:hypothetical protein [Oscillospiraceae bacterium]
MITYRISSEWHFGRELGLYHSFGLKVYLHRKLFLHIPDIFCRRRKAAAFARLCNREQPALVHLWDVIEDAL